jgi:hypothetical protein
VGRDVLARQVWLYRIGEAGVDSERVNQRDYIGAVTAVVLNETHAAVLTEGRVQLHLIEEVRSSPTLTLGVSRLEGSRASPPHRPREEGFTYHAGTSRSNLASALGLLSRWRLAKP